MFLGIHLYLYLHLSLHPSLYLYLRLSLHPSLYRCVPKIGFLEFTRKTNYVDKSALFQNYVGESALFSAEEPPRNRRGTRGIVVYLKSGSWSFHGAHKRKQRKSIRWTFSSSGGFFGETACPVPAVPGNPFEIPLEPYSYRC